MLTSQVVLKRHHMISTLANLSTGGSKNLWVMIRAERGCTKRTEISRVPFVRSKMPSLPSPDALFVSRKRRSYQVSFSLEEADSERSFQLRNDLYGLRTL